MIQSSTNRLSLSFAAACTVALAPVVALAQEAAEEGLVVGAGNTVLRGPEALNTRFQPYATDIMREIAWFEEYTLWFLVPIGIFVGALLAYVIWKYNAANHPVASRTSHNTTIEVVWTIAPVLVLLFLAVPSFQLLSAQFDPPEDPSFTVKTTGYQWYWDYEYQNDETGEALLSFSSIPLLQDDDRDTFGKTDRSIYPNLLAVDNEFVVPEDVVVRLLVTGGDVIHSWAMPSFGKKMDAIPGRLNETWFKVNEPGLYYGQCSELCGKDHAFMPIAVRVVTQPQFDRWVQVATEVSLNEANKRLLTEIEGVAGAAAAEAVDEATPNNASDDTPGGDAVTDAEEAAGVPETEDGLELQTPASAN